MSKSKELGKAFPEYFSEGELQQKFLQHFTWYTKKPKFDKECLLITASKFRGVWEYTVFTIQKQNGEEGWYFGWFTGEGDEYGALEDLRADRYLVLPLLKNTK